MTAEAREQERVVGGMSTRTAAWLAWLLAGLSLAMFLASVALYVAARSTQVPSTWGTGGIFSALLIFVPFLAFPIVGALIASRRPENPIGWICLADGFLWMLIDLIDSYSFYGLTMPGSLPFPVTITALSQWLWVPAVGLLGTYLVLLFPDGKLPSRRWRPLAWLSGVVIVLLSAAILLTPGPLEALGELRNPFGLEGQPWVEDAAIVLTPLLPLCALASAASLVLRYRRSGGEMREQIKWIVFAASFVGLVALSTVVSTLVFAPESLNTAGRQPLWLEVLQDVELLSLAGVPVAIGFAVLKYRLYEIDLIINRTLVYGSLTVSLAAVYFGGVATTEAIFRALTGQQKQPQLAIVVSTLVIAALFNPLRRRIQSFIDRRFYRRKYDARRTLETFSAKLRDETDLNTLSEDLTSLVRETMQPAHVSLWLRPDTPLKSEKAE